MSQGRQTFGPAASGQVVVLVLRREAVPCMGQTKCMWLHVAHDSGRMRTSIGVGVSMHVKRVRRWQPQNNAVAVYLDRASIEKTRATEKEMRGGHTALRDTGRTAC